MFWEFLPVFFFAQSFLKCILHLLIPPENKHTKLSTWSYVCCIRGHSIYSLSQATEVNIYKITDFFTVIHTYLFSSHCYLVYYWVVCKAVDIVTCHFSESRAFVVVNWLLITVYEVQHCLVALHCVYLTLLISFYTGEESSNYEPGPAHWFDSPSETSHRQIITAPPLGSIR